MKIAICEDLKSEQDSLFRLLSVELANRKIEGEIVVFDSGEALLEAMQTEVFPINFLDVYMDKVTGVEVAREIRARNKNAAIVFTTTSPDHMADGFDVGALHYLVKPYNPEDAHLALGRCLNVIGMSERFIEITVDREKRKLLLSQILWTETQGKSCIIRIQGESLRVNIVLPELLELIDDTRFWQCQRSYAVNLDHVSRVKGGDFLMQDSHLIPIRREDRAEAKQILQNYNFEKLRGGDSFA